MVLKTSQALLTARCPRISREETWAESGHVAGGMLLQVSEGRCCPLNLELTSILRPPSIIWIASQMWNLQQSRKDLNCLTAFCFHCFCASRCGPSKKQCHHWNGHLQSYSVGLASSSSKAENTPGQENAKISNADQRLVAGTFSCSSGGRRSYHHAHKSEVAMEKKNIARMFLRCVTAALYSLDLQTPNYTNSHN